MEQEAYEKILSQLEKPQKGLNSMLKEIKDKDKFSKYIMTKDLTPKAWNNLLVNIHQIQSESLFDDLSTYILSSEPDKKNGPNKGAKSWIQVYNTVATHYLKKANMYSDKAQKEKNLQLVTQAIGRSDRIDVLDSSLFVLKGFFYFYQGSFKDAIMYFKNAIEYHPTQRLVAARIGQACVEFAQNKYDQALSHFTQAAKMNPKIIPKLKFALAYSCFNVKRWDQARRIFNSILQRDAKNVEANIGLAMISKSKKDYSNYFKYLLISFNEAKENCQVLLELAEHYMYKEDFERALKLAKSGINQLEIYDKKLQEHRLPQKSYKELKSRFNYVFGHIQYYQKNNKEALNFFLKAIEAFPSNFEAQFNLGQIYLADRNWKNALPRFEYIVKHCKKMEAGECFKILGYLYSKVKNKDAACTYYEKALAFDPNDYECMLEYAAMLETINPAQSLEIYLKSLKIMEMINDNENKEVQPKVFIHPEILLNVAVLKHKLGKLEEAREDFLSLQGTVKEYFKYTQNERYQALIQMIMFNLGCVLEDEGDLIGSRDTFRELVVANPLNVDAFMRLSNIHLTFGDFDKAREISSLLTEKMKMLSHNLGADKMKAKLSEVLCFQAYVDNKTGRLEAAVKAISSIRDKCQYEDPYGKLLQASINYDLATQDRQDKDQHKKMLKLVTHDAKAVLKADEGNYFAAMVLGITLAESQHFSKAWNTFSMMLESCEQENVFLLNSAKLALIMRRFDSAVGVLTSYLENNRSAYEALPEVLLGFAFLKEKCFQDARRVYQRLVLKYPGNLSYRFNLCSILLEEAYEIIHQEYRHFYQTEQSLKNLKTVQPMLESLKASAVQKLENDDTNMDEKLSKTYKVELKKMIELATKKLAWISTKIPVFEKAYEQEKENLRIRQVIRDEKHAQRGKQIFAEKDENKLEQKARQMRDSLMQVSDELRRSKEERKMKQEMRKAGVKMPKQPKIPKAPKIPKELKEDEEPKPKRLPKKFHLRYFLMGDENKKKKKGREDREESDATSEDEEEVEELEEELEEPRSEEAGDENLDVAQDDDLGVFEEKPSPKRSRLNKLKKKGNGNLNKMIRNFVYKGADIGIKGKKKRKLNSGRESMSGSNEDDELEELEEEMNGFVENANGSIGEEQEELEEDEDIENEGMFNEDMYMEGHNGDDEEVFVSGDES